MNDYVGTPNLELIINGESWKVILLHAEEPRRYYMTCLYTKTLYIHDIDIDSTKHAVWQNHHEPYREQYY